MEKEEKVAHINGRYLALITIISLGGTFATLFYQGKNNSQNIRAKRKIETATKFRCEEVSRLVGIVARIASIKEKQIIADTDDLLILNALQENFIKYQKINPECDKLTSNGILTEIQQAESILKKYE